MVILIPEHHFLSPTNASNYVDYEENKIDEILQFDSRKSNTPSVERVVNEPEQVVKGFTPASVVQSPANQLATQSKNKSKHKSRQGPEID